MASLVVWKVKNLPAMQETRVQSLGQEDPLKKVMATHFSILNQKLSASHQLEYKFQKEEDQGYMTALFTALSLLHTSEPGTQ